MTKLKHLLGDIVKQCVDNNIELKLVPKDHVLVDHNIKCSGYFDDTSLVVASGKKDWVDVLIHESCHLDQFIGKSKIYDKGGRGIIIIDEWLGGKNINKTRLYKSFQDSILMELDCEKRTVKKIKKYKININITKYIQQVNAYLLSYWATYQNRKWYPFPYNNPRIVKNMPKVFLQPKEYLAPHEVYLKFFNEKGS
jgi:hypothetical protein